MAGALALSGVFPFAGFWSKDEILGMNFKGGGYIVWAIGLIAAFITAFYTFRLIFMTFWGKSRMDPEVEHHVHESPWSMVVPLIVLGALSVVGGFLGFPPENGVFHKFLEPVFEPANAILGVHHEAFGAHRPGADGGIGGGGALGGLPRLFFYVRRARRSASEGRCSGAAAVQGDSQQVVHR